MISAMKNIADIFYDCENDMGLLSDVMSCLSPILEIAKASCNLDERIYWV